MHADMQEHPPGVGGAEATSLRMSRDRGRRGPRNARVSTGAFHSLRYRDYRLLWTGAVLSNIGLWMHTVALSWYVLDRSLASTSGASARSSEAKTRDRNAKYRTRIELSCTRTLRRRRWPLPSSLPC